MLNLTRLHLGIAHESQFQGLGIRRDREGWHRAALIRCRVLAAKIANELRNKRPEHFVSKLSLADIHTPLSAPPICSNRACSNRKADSRSRTHPSLVRHADAN